jgi:hypothetical protein
MALILDGTNGLSDVDGSAATPAIRGTDTNTGIFFPAADTIAFSEGGTEVARFDSAGNLGIGTASPAQKLDVNGPVKSSGFFLGTTGTSGFAALGTTGSAADGGNFIGRSTTSTVNPSGAEIYAGGAERMRIASSGNVFMSAGLTTNSLTATVRSVNFSTTEVCICPASGTGNNVFLNVSDSVGSNGSSYSFVIRGLGSGGTAQATLSSVQIDATTTSVNTLSKTGGSFRIPHPLPELNKTHDLVHSFVESPDANNIYRGVVNLVNGQATVNLDQVSRMTEGTFVVLNREVQSFVSNQSDWDAVKASVNGNMLTIQCQNAQSTASISWLVIGMRQDKYMFDTDWTDDSGYVITEPLKKPEPENDLPQE